MAHIPVIISSRYHSKITSHRPFHKRNRTRNNNNLIKIYPKKNLHNTGVNTLSQNNPSHVPKVMLTNVRSLVPKLDEVQEFLFRNDINFAFITETWLKESIAESIINIPGYTVFRRDRKNDDHGGVCAYIRTEKCNYRRMDELNCCENHEILWLYLRPDRLPRGFSCIIAGLVYHPPSGDANLICDHLFNSLTKAESKYPNCGILVTGDFNRLNINRLLNHFRLKQIVKVHTRKDAILDLMLTNMHNHFCAPKAYAPFGLSDHNTIVAEPNVIAPKGNNKKVIIRRDCRASRKAEMGRYLSLFDWSQLFAPLDSSEEKWSVFHEVIHNGLNLLMPEKRMEVSTVDAPWMNKKLKSLIAKRQKAFNKNGSGSLDFKYYRNLVNRERKACRGKYYESNIQNLKGENPKRWWNEAKRLSGMKEKNSDLTSQIKIDEFSNLPQREQANIINTALLEPIEEYRLVAPPPCCELEESMEVLTVTEMRVEKALAKLNPGKASGPDNIPNWLLRDYSRIVALPIMNIINTSYREQHLPACWKMADVSPLPKKKPVKDLKKDLRPISLTPCVSKVAEGFLVEDYVKPAILKVIDPNQYGTIPNSSTTIALINMLHHWFLGTDGNGSTIRTILFDYRKAFDLIDHGILIDKLSRLELPPSVINWIIDFLTDRFQRVKLADDCFSEWGSVPAGVPQGTKLGPWLFALMINDLIIDDAHSRKYVDDTTASEIVSKGGTSHAQNIVDQVVTWSSNNRVQLNQDKCKELRISFANQPAIFDPLTINGKELEVVKTVKLLGLTVKDNLTWNSYVDEVIKKVNKRLYFLVQLRRARVPPQDLALFYTSCVRSVVDYAIPAFYHCLPQYLKHELVRLEKRAISIIMPDVDYLTGLKRLDIKPMKDHHEYLCDKLFKSIVLNPDHKLNSLLPARYNTNYNLRNQRNFNFSQIMTNRTMNSFIFSMCSA